MFIPSQKNHYKLEERAGELSYVFVANVSRSSCVATSETLSNFEVAQRKTMRIILRDENLAFMVFHFLSCDAIA